MVYDRETSTATERVHDDWQTKQKSGTDPQKGFETKTDPFTDWLTDGPLLHDLEMHFELNLD
jgi:hypothetical protein